MRTKPIHLIAFFLVGLFLPRYSLSDPESGWDGPYYSAIGVDKDRLMVLSRKTWEAKDDPNSNYCVYDISHAKGILLGECKSSESEMESFKSAPGFTILENVDAELSFSYPEGEVMKLPNGARLLFQRDSISRLFTVFYEKNGKTVSVLSDLRHAAEHSGECSMALLSTPDAYILLSTNYGDLEVVKIAKSLIP